MDIKNKFTKEDSKRLSKQITLLISQEDSLTNRGIKEIEGLIRNNSFFVALGAENKIKGFIVKEKLIQNYYEIKCWYVVPSFRKKGLAIQLLNSAVKDNGHNYIGVTFQDKIVQKVGSFGFKPTSLVKLPPGVLLAYIFTRRPASILKHLFRRKSILLLKKCV